MDTNKDYLIALLDMYLRSENHFINKDDFALQLLSNPSYPSLKAITDTLDFFKVENFAATIPKSALYELNSSFLASIDDENGSSLALALPKKEGFQVIKNDNSKVFLKTDDFKTIWNGSVLVVERNDKGTLNYSNNSNLISLILSLTYLSLLLLNDSNLAEFLYSFIAIVGFQISVLIAKDELGFFSKISSKICSSVDGMNCAQVIGSNSATILGRIKLSDSSLAFFGVLLLVIPIMGVNYTLFMIVSVLLIPIMIYSIIAQGFIIKKWCPLCLFILATLSFFIGLSVYHFDYQDISARYIISYLLISSGVYILWLRVKSFIRNFRVASESQTKLLTILRNPQIIDLWFKENYFNELIPLESSSEISFGNPDSNFTITAVTNPFCIYCKDHFEIYDQLLESHSEKLKVRFIFNISPASEDYELLNLTMRILELYDKDQKICFSALKEWYSQHEKDTKSWLGKYGKPSDEAKKNTIIHHFNWCLANQVAFTPISIVGEYFYPKEYEIEDLPIIIEDVLEHSINQKSNEINTT